MTHSWWFARSVAIAFAGAFVWSACAHAGYRVVKEEAHEGELAIAEKDDPGRSRAEAYIRHRCGRPGYTIDHEGPPLGAGTFRGGDTSWRIAYRCNPVPLASQHVVERDEEEGRPDAGRPDAGAGANAAPSATSTATPGGGGKHHDGGAHHHRADP